MKDFEFSREPLGIGVFVERLNEHIDLNVMKKLPATAVTNWLLKKGYLYKESLNGKKKRLPTKEGGNIGIMTEVYRGDYGEFKSAAYGEAAQRFIIANLSAIVPERNGSEGNDRDG